MSNETHQNTKVFSKQGSRQTGPYTGSTSNGGRSQKPKGKSKYAGKARTKKFVKPVKPSGPVNTYTSVCCGAPSTKPACTKASKVKGATPQSLGHWRCTQCKKVCKVTVSKYKAPELLTVVAPPQVMLVDVIGTLVPLNTPVLTEVETVIITTEEPLG